MEERVKSLLLYELEGKRKVPALQEKIIWQKVFMLLLDTIEGIEYSDNTAVEDSRDLKIEIMILGEEKLMDENYEKGIHGIRLEGYDKRLLM